MKSNLQEKNKRAANHPQHHWHEMNRKQKRETMRKVQSQDLSLEVIHPDAAGIDIGNESHYMAVPPDRDDRGRGIETDRRTPLRIPKPRVIDRRSPGFMATDVAEDVFVLAQPARIYVGQKTSILLSVICNRKGRGVASVTLSGHLVNVP
jgi:hypothetical protein